MQLRLSPKRNRTLVGKLLAIKTILILLVFFLGIFLLDKIDFPVPSKLIEQEISNEKLETLK
tara:strand:- start:434 stop:619 length:186 start_codon:yes stop_codon:yes gene_type:complete